MKVISWHQNLGITEDTEKTLAHLLYEFQDQRAENIASPERCVLCVGLALVKSQFVLPGHDW